MNPTIKLLLGFLILPSMLLAQRPGDYLPQKHAAQVNEKFSTIYIVKSPSSGSELMTTRALIINNSKIADVKQMKTEDVYKRFGTSERLVVLIVTPKPGTQLLSIAELYKKRNLNGKRNLPLKIDGRAFRASDDVIVDETSVKSFNGLADSVVLKTSNRDEFLEINKVSAQTTKDTIYYLLDTLHTPMRDRLVSTEDEGNVRIMKLNCHCLKDFETPAYLFNPKNWMPLKAKALRFITLAKLMEITRAVNSTDFQLKHVLYIVERKGKVYIKYRAVAMDREKRIGDEVPIITGG